MVTDARMVDPRARRTEVAVRRATTALLLIAVPSATGCGALWGFDELSREADAGGPSGVLTDGGRPDDGGVLDGGGPGIDAGDASTTCKLAPGSTTNLALNKPASADQERSPAENASKANDGNTTTRWSSSDGVPGHAWTIDLGDNYVLTNIRTKWEYDGIAYQYVVEASGDGATFQLAIDRTSDTRTTQVRSDPFPSSSCARFVRIKKTDTTGYWAILYEVEIFGSQ